MGIFGKSKAEKERELKQKEWEVRRAEEEKQIEADYQTLVQAMERVERLDPKWEVNISKSLLDIVTKYKSDRRYYVSYKSPDGISISLWSDPQTRSADARGSSGPSHFYKIRITNETTTIYENKFHPGHSKSWKLLDDYMRRLVEPLIQQKNREKEEQERRGQTAKDKFWNN